MWRFTISSNDDHADVEKIRDECAQFLNALSLKYDHLDMESSFTDSLGDGGAWKARDDRDPTHAGRVKRQQPRMSGGL